MRALPRPVSMQISQETLPLIAPMQITGYLFTDATVIVVRLRSRDLVGEGEASGVYYLGDDAASMVARLEAVRGEVEAGLDRMALQTLLPAGGARNALDAALWDLEAKLSGKPAWMAAGLVQQPRPLQTTFTLGADDPAVMAAKATGYGQARALKLKLTGEPLLDAERVRAVRAARPTVWMGVDANQGFVPHSLDTLMPTLVACNVRLLEQPFARGREADLDGFSCPIPLAADESLQGLADVESLVGRFDVLNIKLDKCGGLTEGLAIVAAARKRGLGVMVGNMGGSSLAMAPACLLGQSCDVVDLDGPLFISRDRAVQVRYDDGLIRYPSRGWGAPA